jgi:hypothetical protein
MPTRGARTRHYGRHHIGAVRSGCGKGVPGPRNRLQVMRERNWCALCGPKRPVGLTSSPEDIASSALLPRRRGSIFLFSVVLALALGLAACGGGTTRRGARWIEFDDHHGRSGRVGFYFGAGLRQVHAFTWCPELSRPECERGLLFRPGDKPPIACIQVGTGSLREAAARPAEPGRGDASFCSWVGAYPDDLAVHASTRHLRLPRPDDLDALQHDRLRVHIESRWSDPGIPSRR